MASDRHLAMSKRDECVPVWYSGFGVVWLEQLACMDLELPGRASTPGIASATARQPIGAICTRRSGRAGSSCIGLAVSFEPLRVVNCRERFIAVRRDLVGMARF